MAGFGAKRQRRGSAGVALDLRGVALVACALTAATAGLAAVRMYRGLGELQAGSFSEARARFLRREEVPERPLRRSRPAVGGEEGAGNGDPEDEQRRGGEDVDYGEVDPHDYALGEGAVEEDVRLESHEGEAADYEGDYEGDYLTDGTRDYAMVEGALVRSPTLDIDSLVAAAALPVRPAARLARAHRPFPN